MSIGLITKTEAGKYRGLTDSPVEVRNIEGRPAIEGYAALFNSPSVDFGGWREKIRPGAFDASLKEIHDGKRHIHAFVQHEGGLSTIGNTENNSLLLVADPKGLKYTVIPPDTGAGRDILTLIKGGYINKSSFAFSLRGQGEKWHLKENPPVRELIELNLEDVSPVTGPAYLDTSVQARSSALASLEEARKYMQNDIETRDSKTRVETRAVDGGSAVDIYILDEIVPTWIARLMFDMVGSGQIIEALAAVPDAKTINVYINSPGGDVFEASTIFNTLKQHPAPVNVYIQGLAASAASYIAMAGDNITMGEGTFMMIHNAWTAAMGNAQDMREQALFLDKIDGEIAGIYARRTGQDLKEVKRMMRDETWLTAEEAVNLRFADKASATVETALTEADGERCRKLGYRNIPKHLGGRGKIEVRNVASVADWKAVIAQSIKEVV